MSLNEVMVLEDKLPKGSPFSYHNHREKANDEDDVTDFDASASKIIAPVSLVGLFRYFKIDHLLVVYLHSLCFCSFATRFELALDVVGLIAAAGAGAAQVCPNI
jgi:hypothetical protein